MPARKRRSGFGILSMVAFYLAIMASCATNSPSRQKVTNLQTWEPRNLEFRSFYGWDEKAGSWKMEKVQGVGGKSIAIHIFRPPFLKRRRGTVFLHHGYLDHSALRVPLAMEFVKRGWTVVGVDLPGHGLSSGKRADIDNLDDYAAAFEAAMKARYWAKPWRAVGHSTGAATILLTMQNNGRKFDFVVLEAPLVRTFMWTPTMWLKDLVEGKIETMPRRSEGTHADEPFFQLCVKDPFYVADVPLHWFDAVERYYQSTLEWKPIKGRVLILQGEKDTAVDTKYNLAFLREILPDAEIIDIENGRHHLFMDIGSAGDEARAALFSRW